jgi:hypothetical protein
MVDGSKVTERQRTSEYYYSKSLSSQRSGNLKEASLNLWKSAETLILALADFKAREIKNFSEAISFLEEYKSNGMVSQKEIYALKANHINSQRGNMEAQMFSIEAERTQILIQKLKKILKDYLVNGPPKEDDFLAKSGENEEDEIKRILEEVKKAEYAEKEAESSKYRGSASEAVKEEESAKQVEK